MKICRFEEAYPHLAEVISAADSNKKSFGFLCPSAYEQSLLKGNLWILEIDKEYIGHLLVGGRYPTVKIFQLYIRKEHSNNGYASYLLDELVDDSKKKGYQTITAKVAAELEANLFWKNRGFILVRQESGKGSKPRLVNRYILDIDRSSLFDSIESEGFKPEDVLTFSNRPILNQPVYTMDISIILDLVKDRDNGKYVSNLLSLAISGHIRLCLTKEIIIELERNRLDNDPLLMFAKQMKILPEIDDKNFKELCLKILEIVFPEENRRITKNDLSDVKHIATSIHYGTDAFITSDKKILRAAEIISKKYKLDIISPYELFFDLNDRNSQEILSIEVSKEDVVFSEIHETLTTKHISITDSSENEKKDRLALLREKYHFKYNVIVGNIIVGFLGIFVNKHGTPRIHVDIILDEEIPQIYYIIDWYFEKIHSFIRKEKYAHIEINLYCDAVLFLESAKKLGFFVSDSSNSNHLTINKLHVNKIIVRSVWAKFNNRIQKEIGCRFSSHFPNMQEMKNSGLLLSNSEGKKIYVNLYDFETFFSPSVLFCDEREAVIIPMRMEFAETFFPQISKQIGFFPGNVVSVCREKAYYRNPSGANKFKRGQIAFIYVSGAKNGLKQIIGHARITFSNVVDATKVPTNYIRQGVLNELSILGRSSKNKINVITFDNFHRFTKPIDYSALIENDLISRANLVTAEIIDHKKAAILLRLGY